jgi:prevent-host-death family protein
MTQRVSVAQAKAQLSALMAPAAYGGQHIIIERRGKPLAALVSIDDLERLENGQTKPAKPRGALALVGAWENALTDEEIDEFIRDVYAARERDMGRPVDLGD